MQVTIRNLVVVSVGMFLFGCADKFQPANTVANQFTVTNFVNPSGDVETILLFTNGTYFGFRTNFLSVDVPGHYTAWIYLDLPSNKPRMMIHQFYGTNRYWLTDRDGDGVPDSRVNYNEGPDRGSKAIFFKGDWIEADIRQGTNASGMIDGKPAQYQFANGKWSEVER